MHKKIEKERKAKMFQLSVLSLNQVSSYECQLKVKSSLSSVLVKQVSSPQILRLESDSSQVTICHCVKVASCKKSECFTVDTGSAAIGKSFIISNYK